MDNIKNKKPANLLYTIFVFDRGYASKKLIAYIEDDIKAQYLFRLRSKFNNEIDALPAPESSKHWPQMTSTLTKRNFPRSTSCVGRVRRSINWSRKKPG